MSMRTRITAAAAALALTGGAALAPSALAQNNPNPTATSAPGSVGVGATVQGSLTISVSGNINFGSIQQNEVTLAGSTPIGHYWTPLPAGSPWVTGFAGSTGTEQVDVGVVSNDAAGYYVTETLNGPMTAPGVTQTIPDSDIFAWLDNSAANSNPYVFSGLASAPAGVGTGVADQGIFATSSAVSASGGDSYPLALGLDTPPVLPAGSYSTSLSLVALGN